MIGLALMCAFALDFKGAVDSAYPRFSRSSSGPNPGIIADVGLGVTGLIQVGMGDHTLQLDEKVMVAKKRRNKALDNMDLYYEMGDRNVAYDQLRRKWNFEKADGPKVDSPQVKAEVEAEYKKLMGEIEADPKLRYTVARIGELDEKEAFTKEVRRKFRKASQQKRIGKGFLLYSVATAASRVIAYTVWGRSSSTFPLAGLAGDLSKDLFVDSGLSNMQVDVSFSEAN